MLQVVLFFALVLPILSIRASLQRQRLRRFTVRANAGADLNDDFREKLLSDNYMFKFNKGGPGHISDRPSTYTNNGQRELARIIVGIAVLYMSFKVKMQNMYARANSTEGNLDGNTGSAKSDVGKEGIRFVEVVRGNVKPKDGQDVFITAKFIHNGLALDIPGTLGGIGGLDGHLIKHYVDEKKFMGEIRGQLSLPTGMDNVVEAYKGMRLGGRRQASISLPQGFPPYVLPGSSVVAVLELKKVETIEAAA